jgi:aminopeptidase YwaD
MGEITAYLLLHTDSLVSKMGWAGTAEVNNQLPRGFFIMPRQGKPLWSVARKEIEPTLVYIYDTLAFQKRKSRWTAHIDNQFIAEYPSENIIGRVPGTVQKDSFIVVTAHYDHLGKMGASAMFPGASDNASGTAMLLALAQYYARHPQPYTMVFIAFAGEEAGLMGSRYFVEHPLFDLAAIRFLINLDIMGDASNGITVVNGSVHPQEFDLLQKVNIGAKPVARIKTSPLIGERDEEERASIDDTAIQTEADAPREIPEIAGLLLPEIKVRGAAANSDHYPFSEKGVPAFFIFTNGGPGYYHDVWDKPEQVSLANIEELSELLFRFITALQ